MGWVGNFSSLFFLFFVVSCVEPVIRRTQDSGPVEAADYDKADLRKKLWVVPFDASFAWNQDQGAQPKIMKTFHDTLKNEVGKKSGPFMLATPFGQGIDDFQISSTESDSELKRIALASGADGYLKGNIVNVDVLRTQLPDGLVKVNEFRIELRVNFELYDAFSGRLMYRGEAEEKHVEQRSDLLRVEIKYPELERRLKTMSETLAKRVLANILPSSSRLGWTGRILSVENARVYLNAGDKTGLRIGDILKVVEPHKQIQDFESGRFVGRVPGRIKGTLKVIQFFGDDGAIAVLQSGAGFSSGDIVQLY